MSNPMNNDAVKQQGGAVAAVVVFFILLFLYTTFVGAIPLRINSVTTQKSDTFNVSATGESSAIPDAASVTVGVEEQGATVQAAQEALNGKIKAVTQAVKSQGVNAEDIKTTNYSIHPNYDYQNNSQRIIGYRASSNIHVKTKETGKVNAVIDAATAAGANNVGGISFEVSDPEAARNEARKDAVQKARANAEQAASVAGFKLGRMVNYAESFGGDQGPILYRQFEMAADSAAPTQVEPGSTDITVTVTLSFEIE